LAPITLILLLGIGFPNATPLKIAGVAVIVVVSFYIAARYLLPCISNLIKQFQPKNHGIISKLFYAINALLEAIESTVKAGILGKVIGLSVMTRLLKYGGLLILFHRISKANFPDLRVLSTFETLGAIIASEMTAALPIPTLMSFGTWEVGGMTFMAIMGAPPQSSLITLIGVHILTQAVDYGIDIGCLFMLFGILFKSSRQTSQLLPKSSQPSRYPVKSTAFALISLLFLVYGW